MFMAEKPLLCGSSFKGRDLGYRRFGSRVIYCEFGFLELAAQPKTTVCIDSSFLMLSTFLCSFQIMLRLVKIWQQSIQFFEQTN
ncbi:hypothetical protein NIES2100_62590 [Calothrix sp. NIES-2100]|nr:hypothetical protein NIES2100_62590 [Calothrix sp. NIES-2100]